MRSRHLARGVYATAILVAAPALWTGAPATPAGWGDGVTEIAYAATQKAQNPVDRAKARARARARARDRKVRPKVPERRAWVIQGSMEAATLFYINQARARHGLRPVRGSRKLRRPARAHSRFLATRHKGRLFHEDARGRPFYARLVAAGWPRNRRMSENLASITACRKKDPRLMVAHWLRSSGHRANVLDPTVRFVGVGVVSTRHCNVTVYTTDFGA